MSTLIIIPTVTGNDLVLNKCIQSLIKNTPEEFDLYVAKNNFAGFATAVNRGLRAFNAEHLDGVVILNDDIELKPGWLRKLKDKAYSSADIGLVGDELTIRPDHIAFWMVFIKKEVLQKVGLLDERFRIGDWEDNDFCARAIDAGFKLDSVGEALAEHLISYTWRAQPNAERAAERAKNKERFREKWKGTRWENRWV